MLVAAALLIFVTVVLSGLYRRAGREQVSLNRRGVSEYR